MRVDEFANRFGISVEEVLAACSELGFDATDASSEIDEAAFTAAVTPAAARDRAPTPPSQPTGALLFLDPPSAYQLADLPSMPPPVALDLPSRMTRRAQLRIAAVVGALAVLFVMVVGFVAGATSPREPSTDVAADNSPTHADIAESLKRATTIPTTATTVPPTTTPPPPTTRAPVVTAAPRYVAPAPRPTQAASNCHPSYDPCIAPTGGDVDCAGGSGNGPRYVDGPVYVKGYDEYDLDRDGDGVGCES